MNSSFEKYSNIVMLNSKYITKSREIKFSYCQHTYSICQKSYIFDNMAFKGYDFQVEHKIGRISFFLPHDFCVNGPYSNIFRIKDKKLIIKAPKDPHTSFLLKYSITFTFEGQPAYLVSHDSIFVQLDSDGRSDIDQHMPPSKHVAYRRPISECPPTSSHHAMDSIDLFYCPDTGKTSLGEIRMIDISDLGEGPWRTTSTALSKVACCEMLTCQGIAQLVCSDADMLFELLIKIRRVDIDISQSINFDMKKECIRLENLNAQFDRNFNTDLKLPLVFKVSFRSRPSRVIDESIYNTPNFADRRDSRIAKLQGESHIHHDAIYSQLCTATTQKELTSLSRLLRDSSVHHDFVDVCGEMMDGKIHK